jgi:hypothetical protein
MRGRSANAYPSNGFEDGNSENRRGKSAGSSAWKSR